MYKIHNFVISYMDETCPLTEGGQELWLKDAEEISNNKYKYCETNW